jgi:hypothetical protein
MLMRKALASTSNAALRETLVALRPLLVEATDMNNARQIKTSQILLFLRKWNNMNHAHH